LGRHCPDLSSLFSHSLRAAQPRPRKGRATKPRVSAPWVMCRKQEPRPRSETGSWALLWDHFVVHRERLARAMRRSRMDCVPRVPARKQGEQQTLDPPRHPRFGGGSLGGGPKGLCLEAARSFARRARVTCNPARGIKARAEERRQPPRPAFSWNLNAPAKFLDGFTRRWYDECRFEQLFRCAEGMHGRGRER